MSAVLEASAIQAMWDAVAGTGATVSCGFTLLRRHMLSGGNPAWHSAPGLVQASLSFQAIVTGGVAVSLLFGAHHATQIETLLLVVSAAVSTALAINLDRLGRRDAAAES